MKRIAAIVTLAFAVLAVPAAAMASTSGSGTGGGSNGYTQVIPVRAVCPLPGGIRVKPGQAVQVRYASGQARTMYRKVEGKQVRFFCPAPGRLLKLPLQVCGRTGDLRHAAVKRHVNQIFRIAAVCRQGIRLFVNGNVSAVHGSACASCADGIGQLRK
jgi:hypothetical protein